MSYWQNKRVVLTGGRGFLGNHVHLALQEAGCPHTFVVRSSEYDLTKESDARGLFADLKAGKDGWPARWQGRSTPADVVIHLAGFVGGIGANKDLPADFFYRNLMMGTHIVHQSWLAGVEKVIAAGAGCGYPEHAPMPLRETSFWDGFPQVESAPYSLAKRMLHVQSMAYWRQHKFPVIVTIPGNIYGPYDNFDLEQAHVVPALVRKFVEAEGDLTVWGSGRPTRDFVYAADVADGILRAGEVYTDSQLVNLSSGADTSIRDIVAILTELTDFQGRIEWDTSRPDGQARRIFDISKAQRELGFEPRTSLRSGLATTVEWYRQHRGVARNRVALPVTA